MTDSAETGDRLVSPLADADDRVIESTLRPKRLNDFIGQSRVREQLSLLLAGALRRGKAPDHVLLSGPPGLGKTTIAMIIAVELGTPLRITSGPAIERAGDLAAVLSTLGDGEVMFIDEIHRLARRAGPSPRHPPLLGSPCPGHPDGRRARGRSVGHPYGRYRGPG